MSAEPKTSDPEPCVVRLPQGELAYIDEGPRQAPALFLIHGVPGSGRDFRYLAPQLTDVLRVLRVDLPGFGGSAPVGDAIGSLSGRARVVLSLADELGVGRFGVLGHSMGGGTALALAAAEPTRVLFLALVASLALAPHRGLGMPVWLIRLLAAGLGVPGLRRAIVAQTRVAYRERRFPGADSLDAKGFRVQLRAIGAADFALMRRAVRRPLPPTLLAYARDDHIVETPISEELARALPQARVLAFDEGGHNIQKTRAVEIAAAIREALLPEATRPGSSAAPPARSRR